jgi:ATP-dependent Clp protease ATP-binding subunit ClpX
MPVVATLAELSEDALVQILTEPKNALVKQYSKLLAMEARRPGDPPRRAQGHCPQGAGAQDRRARAALHPGAVADRHHVRPAQRSNVDKVVVDESTIEENKPPLLVYREAAKKA